MKSNVQNNKVVNSKTPFLVTGPFCSHHSVSTLASDMAVLLWEWCVFNLIAFNLKTPVFWKKFPFSRKSVSKLNYWKRLNFSLIVTKKHGNLSNGGLFWKSLVPFFRKTYALSLGFKMKPLRKDHPKFCPKTCLKEQPFIFTIWWITFFKHLFSPYVIMECLIKLNPIQDGLFRGCSRMGPPSLKSVTHILQWWNLAQLYLT